jgi:hypothetical protein
MWRIIAVTVVAVAAAATFLTGRPAMGQAQGEPMTRSEYFATSVRLMTEVDLAISARYYKLALHRYPPKKCARVARQMNSEFASALAEAKLVVPPSEIASINADLIRRGERVVEAIGRAANQARHRKLVCGDDTSLQIPPYWISQRISRIYERSGFDPTLQKLRDLGYVPSGE